MVGFTAQMSSVVAQDYGAPPKAAASSTTPAGAPPAASQSRRHIGTVPLVNSAAGTMKNACTSNGCRFGGSAVRTRRRWGRTPSVVNCHSGSRLPPRPCALGDRRAQAADEVTVGLITLTIGVAGDLIGNAGVRTADQGPQMRPEPPSAEIF